ncbi:helix-turn-helix transcriptional regulator [Modestobacter marinus]|uniref:helix-turn-helix transcriptional regulator n=1 Tax=Modestobacter marinus TaxID=477641 RepID=UPI001C94A3CE|nr:LuxR family transcriptional regulator [Modestobacter marinus]
MEDVQFSTTTALLELMGRDAELHLVRSFLGRSADHGGALLLTGGPGVGKSVLLEEASRAGVASGARVLRGDGVEFEAEVSFAGLNQLFLPLHDQLAGLPDLQREALTVTLGMGSGPPASRLVVSAAAVALLRRAAEQGPVLVVVDDLQWLDRSSVQVLGFVARRLEGSRVGLLAAARSESDCVLLNAGLPTHEVQPLDDVTATALLRRRFPELAAPVRRRVIDAAEGNPLALLELPATMTPSQRVAKEPLPTVLPLSGQLQQLFADRVRRLPRTTRRLLLLLALEGTGDVGLLRAASAVEGWLDGLAPAERDHLVRVDMAANRVVFRHPLIGAAVVDLATSSERRRTHATLADLLTADPERRAWHLAEAVVGPDEPAAELLELAARRALHKGDAVRAVHALLRAADLSPRGADRARRLAAAAYVGADAAGQLSSVPHLLGQARQADPGATGSLEMTVAAAYHLLNGEGDVDTAHLMLVRGIEQAIEQGCSGPAVEEALHSLMVVCHFSGRDELWRPFESALARLGPGVSPVLAVSKSVYGDPLSASRAALDRLEALLATLDEEVDPTRIVRVGIAAFYVDRLHACRPSLWEVVRDGREGGAAASAVSALMMLCHDAYREGRWDDATRTAEEGIRWSERLGYQLIALPGVYCLALIAAARGDDEACRARTEELSRWAGPRGVTMVEHFASRARAVAALGHGEYEDAFRLTASISPAGRLTPHVPVALWTAKDLVEAAVRTGRAAEAEAHVAAIRRAEVFRLLPRLHLLAAGSAALVASGEEAGDLYRQALSVPGADRFPFEQARVRLSHGEQLRRVRATHAARTELLAALDVFDRLGAQPWVTRTQNELRASGQPHRSSTAERRWDTLTAQEHEIAALAASGLSNKQIGSRLYLSPRTVSGHLYRIFPKLGISTRAALRDALANVQRPMGAAGS